MKKVTIVFLALFLVTKSVYPLRMGLEFGVSDKATVGLNLRLVENFELKPALGFTFTEDDNFFALSVDGNFYLPQIQTLQHYAGPGIWFNVNSDDGYVGVNGKYGLRYNINEVLSTFGEIGLNVQFSPFILTTFRGGLGMTFYFPGMK
ncbi:MAG TPA: hypothetical protein VHO70_02255 [Chitinispirillaceae bacterium]|nr:hypothetical protein [Chitinispirillaceae bacterium]